jgi:AraC-like DNA-binding protein
LQNPNLRIRELAFDVGFQSLSQFKRTFKKVTGQSPKQFRASLRAA